MSLFFRSRRRRRSRIPAEKKRPSLIISCKNSKNSKTFRWWVYKKVRGISFLRRNISRLTRSLEPLISASEQASRPIFQPAAAADTHLASLQRRVRSWLHARANTSVTTRSTTMPDAMMNGGFAPYLAQAFTPQGVPGGQFGSGIGNIPGTIFGNPIYAQNYGSAFTGTPQFGPNVQPWAGWQQQLTPQLAPTSTLGQVAGSGWPYPHQFGQSFNQPYTGWQQQLLQQPALAGTFGQVGGQGGIGFGWPYGQGQLGQGQSVQNFWQEPLILANLLRQYAVPISAVIASPYGQAHIAQQILQTAEMLTRVLPLVGAPQLIPVAQLLGQCAVPISAAIASPYGQAHIAQNIAQTADFVARILPLVGAQQLGQLHTQPNTGWQQLVPQLPVANLLGQQPYQQTPVTSFGGVMSGQYGLGQLGQPSVQPDMLGRILPFLAQQGLAGQPYGMARI
jgi:hypothetical protein